MDKNYTVYVFFITLKHATIQDYMSAYALKNETFPVHKMILYSWNRFFGLLKFIETNKKMVLLRTVP